MSPESREGLLNFGVKSVDVSKWHLQLASLAIECQKQYTHPPIVGKEPNERDLDMCRLAHAIVHTLEELYDAPENSHAGDILETISAAISPDIPPSRVFNGFRIYANLVNMNNPTYPTQSQSFWDTFIEETLYRDENRTALLEFISQVRNSTNVPQRFIGALFAIATLQRETMGETYLQLVAGASLCNDLLRAMFADSFNPYIPPDVFADTDLSSRVEADEARMNWLLNNSIFEDYRAVGVDLIDLQNEQDVAAAYAGVYPWELRRTPFAERQAMLQQLNDRRASAIGEKKLELVVGDFCNLSNIVTNTKRALQPGSFHSTLFSTMLNQLNLDQQIRAMEVAQEYTRDGGLIIVQDFTEPRGANGSTEVVNNIEQLNITQPSSREFAYNLWVMRNGESELRKLLSYRTGRALQIVLTKYGRFCLRNATKNEPSSSPPILHTAEQN